MRSHSRPRLDDVFRDPFLHLSTSLLLIIIKVIQRYLNTVFSEEKVIQESVEYTYLQIGFSTSMMLMKEQPLSQGVITIISTNPNT